MPAPLLIVEDDPDIRTDLAELLRGEGYDARTAVDGRDALAQLRGGLSPKLILLDLMMPVMDGWAFRAAQLGDPVLAAFPVVLLSGSGNVSQHAVDLQAVGWIRKPFALDDLLQTVARFG